LAGCGGNGIASCANEEPVCKYTMCPTKQNKYHLIAYMPLLGAIVGVFQRILPAIRIFKDLNPSESFATRVCVTQIFRGVCETLGLGLLFLIPDVIMTIGRLCSGNWFKEEKE